MKQQPEFRIGISGAVPEPEVLKKHKAGSSDIHLSVRRIVERALTDGDVIVYGSHPTFTPIIEEVALQNRRPARKKAVHMFVAQRYFTPQEWADYARRHDRYAKVEPIGDFTTGADQALEELRNRMVAEFDALVCIGGKLHLGDKAPKPGVEEEYQRALKREPPIPIYLLGGCGGYTRLIFDRHDPPRAPNGLDGPENAHLGKSVQVWDSVELVFRGLDKVRARAGG